jgi:hypothetical protein
LTISAGSTRPNHAPGDHQKDEAERDQADMAVLQQELDSIDRVGGPQHARIVMDMQETGDRDGDEPDHHHRAEQACHPRGPAALGREQDE